MTYKMFGTVKQIKCDALVKVLEVLIVPTQEYSVKGTVEPKKTFALIRPEGDKGGAKLFEYQDCITVSGTSIAGLLPILEHDYKIGFEIEEVSDPAKANIALGGCSDCFKLTKVIRV